ncbi:MAG: hypothetical protein A3B13_00930 [Candidatus Liptonbacteria bacterium RIFCSPLOWO2_01_FULL_45_15]|uniref:Uncharacterized protein n=1 Tax=Candidatus Liptonbacteria bacterium RIFCSPLOWO2_01_FULL_45_15 TaxID=1798649 RepID=A0A1G2CJ57_9BACT|nr:MAG: hypothetical protein A3B13_00930 [Candidatus Liptonbacteria bacterium RIFCSPLOWO2_01_FULL_45_15]
MRKRGEQKGLDKRSAFSFENRRRFLLKSRLHLGGFPPPIASQIKMPRSSWRRERNKNLAPLKNAGEKEQVSLSAVTPNVTWLYRGKPFD